MTEPKGSPRRGGAASEASGGGWGKGGDGTKKRVRCANAGPAKSLLFLMFHVKLFLEGFRIDYKVVYIFRFVLNAFK